MFLTIEPNQNHQIGKIKKLGNYSFPQWRDFEDFFTEATSHTFTYGETRQNFTQKDNKYVLELEIPRFKQEEIKIHEENGIVHVSAEREGKNYYASVTFPYDANWDSGTARLDHGVLYLEFAKKAPPEKKFLKVD